MIPAPEVNALDFVFGEIKHLPKWEEIPEQFKRYNATFWNKFITQWFFGGVSKNAVDMLSPKPEVDKAKALKAVASILSSFDPKHEHKEAGAAYLMSEWFEEPKDEKLILEKAQKYHLP